MGSLKLNSFADQCYQGNGYYEGWCSIDQLDWQTNGWEAISVAWTDRGWAAKRDVPVGANRACQSQPYEEVAMLNMELHALGSEATDKAKPKATN